VELAAKVNETTNETKHSQEGEATQEMWNSTVSLDGPSINDTVFVEASPVAADSASTSQNDTKNIAVISSPVMASPADVVDNNSSVNIGNSTTLVPSNTSIANLAEGMDSTVEAGGTKRLIANQTVGAVNQSLGGAVAESENASTVADQNVEKMDTDDETAMPVFVFNGTKLAEDANLVVIPEVPKSSLYSVPSDIALDMDEVGQHMDNLLSNWIDGDRPVTELAQIDDHADTHSPRIGDEDIAGESLHAMSEMSIKLSSLQSALAKMDSAEFPL